ncbi:hypothetical protein BELL_1296g00030 [Botrytis elliptica]|uniref:Uncharacterized protein n=1 Tax=Botrytis elliptica TaxID=278938 RepID=A0A4Z1IFG2_9HELO|nr:hypothetical protein BELL_1296g00030 [Botrytis elliptica]
MAVEHSTPCYKYIVGDIRENYSLYWDTIEEPYRNGHVRLESLIREVEGPTPRPVVFASNKLARAKKDGMLLYHLELITRVNQES